MLSLLQSDTFRGCSPDPLTACKVNQHESCLKLLDLGRLLVINPVLVNINMQDSV